MAFHSQHRFVSSDSSQPKLLIYELRRSRRGSGDCLAERKFLLDGLCNMVVYTSIPGHTVAGDGTLERERYLFCRLIPPACSMQRSRDLL